MTEKITTQWGTQVTPFRALDPETRRMQIRCADSFMREVSAATGLDVYLAYGCLLGAVRDGKVIGHDFDIDVAFHIPSDDMEEVLAGCRKFVRQLTGISRRVIVETNGQIKAQKWFPEHKFCLTLDLFVSWGTGDNYYLYFAVPGAPIGESIFPLGEAEIEGVRMPAPREPEALLAATYGEDWRIPNPDFRYEIDWTPFYDFTVRQNRAHWNEYYAGKTANSVWAEFPSQFAAFVASDIEGGSRILDFGCGNGRDSLFLASIGHDVVAADYAGPAVELVREKAEARALELEATELNIYDVAHVQKAEDTRAGSFDVIYSRFVMHAINEDGQDRFLRMAKTLLKPGGRIYVEFRNDRDARAQVGHYISDNERSDGHYRRFIDPPAFQIEAEKLGYVTEYQAHGKGYAKFRDEDPDVSRMVLRKP